MSWTNYHSHSHYCDGKMAPEEHVKAAIDQGVKIYGFSSHCPVPFENAWSIPKSELPNYLNEIEELKATYEGQLEIYKSLEIDYIKGMISPQSKFILDADLDYSVGSVHFINQFADGRQWEIDGPTSLFKEGIDKIYKGDVKQAVKDYFACQRMMVLEACPDIIGHMDKIKMHNSKEFFFDENDNWYLEEANRTLEEIRSKNAIVEVNTRGLYKKYSNEPYPGTNVLRSVLDMEIPICLNSDSHHPQEITKEFSDTATYLKDIGFKTMRIFKDHEWVDVEFDERGLRI